MKTYKIIGLMSGTSLDGVDLAFCYFTKKSKKWNFKIIKAETFEYPKYWINKLKQLPSSNPDEINKSHVEYGHFLGELAKKFITENNFTPEYIASHGHTIFHEPEKKITFQLGDGVAIAASSGLPVIYDFRSMDVELGGQGAPLVPIGDKLLFGEYEFCLNLGGFSNISFEKNEKRIAFDICPVNIILNQLARNLGKDFDKDGTLAKSGKINQQLLNDLNNQNFYKKPPPKSLANEWLQREFIPLLNNFNISTIDKMRTLVEHFAIQIANSSSTSITGKILTTGGGAFNKFLISRIKHYNQNKIIIPDKEIINFKEAMIFAFLGVLKLLNEVNCLSSVTGASRDCCGGKLFRV